MPHGKDQIFTFIFSHFIPFFLNDLPQFILIRVLLTRDTRFEYLPGILNGIEVRTLSRPWQDLQFYLFNFVTNGFCLVAWRVIVLKDGYNRHIFIHVWLNICEDVNVFFGIDMAINTYYWSLVLWQSCKPTPSNRLHLLGQWA